MAQNDNLELERKLSRMEALAAELSIEYEDVQKESDAAAENWGVLGPNLEILADFVSDPAETYVYEGNFKRVNPYHPDYRNCLRVIDFFLHKKGLGVVDACLLYLPKSVKVSDKALDGLTFLEALAFNFVRDYDGGYHSKPVVAYRMGEEAAESIDKLIGARAATAPFLWHFVENQQRHFMASSPKKRSKQAFLRREGFSEVFDYKKELVQARKMVLDRGDQYFANPYDYFAFFHILEVRDHPSFMASAGLIILYRLQDSAFENAMAFDNSKIFHWVNVIRHYPDFFKPGAKARELLESAWRKFVLKNDKSLPLQIRVEFEALDEQVKEERSKSCFHALRTRTRVLSTCMCTEWIESVDQEALGVELQEARSLDLVRLAVNQKKVDDLLASDEFGGKLAVFVNEVIDESVPFEERMKRNELDHYLNTPSGLESILHLFCYLDGRDSPVSVQDLRIFIHEFTQALVVNSKKVDETAILTKINRIFHAGLLYSSASLDLEHYPFAKLQPELLDDLEDVVFLSVTALDLTLSLSPEQEERQMRILSEMVYVCQSSPLHQLRFALTRSFFDSLWLKWALRHRDLLKDENSETRKAFCSLYGEQNSIPESVVVAVMGNQVFESKTYQGISASVEAGYLNETNIEGPEIEVCREQAIAFFPELKRLAGVFMDSSIQTLLRDQGGIIPKDDQDRHSHFFIQELDDLLEDEKLKSVNLCLLYLPLSYAVELGNCLYGLVNMARVVFGVTKNESGAYTTTLMKTIRSESAGRPIGQNPLMRRMMLAPLLWDLPTIECFTDRNAKPKEAVKFAIDGQGGSVDKALFRRYLHAPELTSMIQEKPARHFYLSIFFDYRENEAFMDEAYQRVLHKNVTSALPVLSFYPHSFRGSGADRMRSWIEENRPRLLPDQPLRVVLDEGWDRVWGERPFYMDTLLKFKEKPVSSLQRSTPDQMIPEGKLRVLCAGLNIDFEELQTKRDLAHRYVDETDYVEANNQMHDIFGDENVVKVREYARALNQTLMGDYFKNADTLAKLSHIHAFLPYDELMVEGVEGMTTLARHIFHIYPDDSGELKYFTPKAQAQIDRAVVGGNLVVWNVILQGKTKEASYDEFPPFLRDRFDDIEDHVLFCLLLQLTDRTELEEKYYERANRAISVIFMNHLMGATYDQINFLRLKSARRYLLTWMKENQALLSDKKSPLRGAVLSLWGTKISQVPRNLRTYLTEAPEKGLRLTSPSISFVDDTKSSLKITNWEKVNRDKLPAGCTIEGIEVVSGPVKESVVPDNNGIFVFPEVLQIHFRSCGEHEVRIVLKYKSESNNVYKRSDSNPEKIVTSFPSPQISHVTKSNSEHAVCVEFLVSNQTQAQKHDLVLMVEQGSRYKKVSVDSEGRFFLRSSYDHERRVNHRFRFMPSHLRSARVDLYPVEFYEFTTDEKPPIQLTKEEEYEMALLEEVRDLASALMFVEQDGVYVLDIGDDIPNGLEIVVIHVNLKRSINDKGSVLCFKSDQEVCSVQDELKQFLYGLANQQVKEELADQAKAQSLAKRAEREAAEKAAQEKEEQESGLKIFLAHDDHALDDHLEVVATEEGGRIQLSDDVADFSGLKESIVIEKDDVGSDKATSSESEQGRLRIVSPRINDPELRTLLLDHAQPLLAAADKESQIRSYEMAHPDVFARLRSAERLFRKKMVLPPPKPERGKKEELVYQEEKKHFDLFMKRHKKSHPWLQSFGVAKKWHFHSFWKDISFGKMEADEKEAFLLELDALFLEYTKDLNCKTSLRIPVFKRGDYDRLPSYRMRIPIPKSVGIDMAHVECEVRVPLNKPEVGVVFRNVDEDEIPRHWKKEILLVAKGLLYRLAEIPHRHRMRIIQTKESNDVLVKDKARFWNIVEAFIKGKAERVKTDGMDMNEKVIIEGVASDVGLHNFSEHEEEGAYLLVRQTRIRQYEKAMETDNDILDEHIKSPALVDYFLDRLKFSLAQKYKVPGLKRESYATNAFGKKAIAQALDYLSRQGLPPREAECKNTEVEETESKLALSVLGVIDAFGLDEAKYADDLKRLDIDVSALEQKIVTQSETSTPDDELDEEYVRQINGTNAIRFLRLSNKKILEKDPGFVLALIEYWRNSQKSKEASEILSLGIDSPVLMPVGNLALLVRKWNEFQGGGGNFEQFQKKYLPKDLLPKSG